MLKSIFEVPTGMRGAKLRQQGKGAVPPQCQIQQDPVRLQPLTHGLRLLSIAGLAHDTQVWFVVDQLTQPFTDDCVVIHNHDPLAMGIPRIPVPTAGSDALLSLHRPHHYRPTFQKKATDDYGPLRKNI